MRVLQFLILGLPLQAHTAFFYPNPQASFLEHILVDAHDAHKSGFADAITPCTNYVSGPQTLGRTTAAQWIRVSFHDFVTADVHAGTGGIDASIGFETLREENSGSAMNDTLGFLKSFMNSKVSMADLIAISVVMSSGNCGGPQIRVRGGRIDATQGGEPGVPAPESNLEETLEFFEGAGFNRVDAIKLTACGHTLGSVHHGGFPTVVGPEAITPDNTGGGIPFDTTRGVFDTNVVHEYLDGNGNKGGALVTSFNETSRSDLRLYESDANDTMVALAGSGTQGFFNTCTTVFQRMLETVPTGVVLSDVILPQTIKPINATLDFDATGNVIFKGNIRILTSYGPAPLQISLTTNYDPKPVLLTPESAVGTSVWGTTTFFPFSIPLHNPSLFRTFSISASGLTTSKFTVQTAAFCIQSQTSISISSLNTSIINFAVAVLSGSPAPRVRIQAPIPGVGTLSPRIVTFENVKVTKRASKPNVRGYDVWSGSLDIGDRVTGAVAVGVLDVRGKEIDVAFF